MDNYQHHNGDVFKCDDKGRPLMSIFSIDRDNRARLDYGDLEETKASIKKRGLLHAVIVTDHKNDKGLYTLLDGGRRCRCCFEQQILEIPVVFWSALDEITRKEIELEGNFHKKFDMEEECELTRQIHELRKKSHGEYTRGAATSQDNAWTIQKLADNRGKSVATVQKEIVIAEAIKKDPKIRDIIRSRKMPKDTAFQMIKQMEKMAGLEALKQQGKLDYNSNLILGDSCELILLQPDSSIDCIITDPPYGNTTIEDSQESRGGGGGQTYLAKLENSDNLTSDLVGKLFTRIVPELFRVLKPGGFFYIFHSEDLRESLTSVLRSVGLEIVPPCVIWNKGRNMTAFSGYNYMSMYEPILFGFKPPRSRRLQFPCGNIIECPPMSSKDKIHPFQKPHELLKKLIENSTSPGELILDPFAGSGSTLKVAHALSRSCLGYEINEKNFHKAQEYLKGGPNGQ